MFRNFIPVFKLNNLLLLPRLSSHPHLGQRPSTQAKLSLSVVTSCSSLHALPHIIHLCLILFLSFWVFPFLFSLWAPDKWVSSNTINSFSECVSYLVSGLSTHLFTQWSLFSSIHKLHISNSNMTWYDLPWHDVPWYDLPWQLNEGFNNQHYICFQLKYSISLPPTKKKLSSKYWTKSHPYFNWIF